MSTPCENRGCGRFDTDEPNNCNYHNDISRCGKHEISCAFCGDTGYTRRELHDHISTKDCDAYNNMQ